MHGADTERPTVSEEVTVGRMGPWDPWEKQSLGGHRRLPGGDEQSPGREHVRSTAEEGVNKRAHRSDRGWSATGPTAKVQLAEQSPLTGCKEVSRDHQGHWLCS